MLPKKVSSIEKSNPSEKNVTVEEELDCIDIDEIGSLEDSPRLVFINEERDNLTEYNQIFNQKKKSGVFQ